MVHCPIACHDSTSWPKIVGGAGIPTRRMSFGVSTTPSGAHRAQPRRMLQLLPPETILTALTIQNGLALRSRDFARSTPPARRQTWARASFLKSAVDPSRTFPPNSHFIIPADLAGASGLAAITARKPATSCAAHRRRIHLSAGYFRQNITFDGWQEEVYEKLNWTDAPIAPAVTPDGKPCVTAVPLGNRTVLVAVWLVHLGRVKLYLLDTDLEENAPWDRELSARLYGGDRESGSRSNMGIGGVRALRHGR